MKDVRIVVAYTEKLKLSNTFGFGLSVLHHPVLQGGIRRSVYWRHERILVNIVASNKRQF